MKCHRRMTNSVRKTPWPKCAEPLAGLGAAFRGVAEGRQRRLWVVELEGHQLYVCMQRGCYAERSARELARTRAGFCNCGAKENLARLA